jgi:hypothetical protein
MERIDNNWNDQRTSSSPTDGALSTTTSDVLLDDEDDDDEPCKVGCDRAANNGRDGAAIDGGTDNVGDVSNNSTVPNCIDALVLLLLLFLFRLSLPLLLLLLLLLSSSSDE